MLTYTNVNSFYLAQWRSECHLLYNIIYFFLIFVIPCGAHLSFSPMNMWKDGRWLSDAVNDSSTYMYTYNITPLPLIHVSPLIHVRMLCCPGLIDFFVPSCYTAFFLIMLQMDVSLLPTLSLFPSSLGFPFPSLSLPRSLSHGFSPTPLSNTILFVLFFLSLKISKNLTDYKSILLGPSVPLVSLCSTCQREKV